MRIHELEEQAQRSLFKLLSDALDRGVSPHVRAREGVFEADIPELSGPVVVAPARESRRALVQSATREARHRAETIQGALPVVVVPHMTPAGREAAESIGVGWFDLAGNAHIAGPGILLHVEGRRPPSRPRGRPASVFAPRGSRVARALLTEPNRIWTQKDLVVATGLGQGMVSRVISRLRDLDLVVQDEDRRYRVPAPGELLDAWRDEYRYEGHQILPVHVTGSGVGLAERLVADLRSADVRCALTGMAAAWLYDRFAQFRLISVFIEGSPSAVADGLSARVEERGANAHLIRPLDDAVFQSERTIEDLPCVHPLQTYLDLTGLPERAEEAAAHLRREQIGY